MKFLIVTLMMMNAAMAAPVAQTRNLPINKDEVAVKKERANEAKTGDMAKQILKDEEDCDDKAEKAKEIEITPESISLGGGDTGCFLEDM